ncbi:MAG: MMPL family transporter [Saprospiraceae bacterium]|nr:MMPL family transporter [Saprospiraceae bacterium]
MFFKYKFHILGIFVLLALVSGFFLPQTKVTFDFDQFFPEGDDDLEYFKSFIEEFEADDNFLLIAVENKEGVFEQDFLNRFHEYSLAIRDVPHIIKVQSLTQMRNPVKTPFGISTIPIIHKEEPSKYIQDKKNLLNDDRFRLSLINADATALVIAAKTTEKIGLEDSDVMLNALYAETDKYRFDDVHYLGRAYFQDELVDMKIWEMLIIGLISVILVIIILILIYRKFIGVMIAVGSIGLGLLLFLGLLAGLGRELSVMAALYPVLMLIVGTSDVIHIMTKYTDLLKEGKDKLSAMTTTVKEIGIATLLTSLTTAVGFATLLTSNVGPIREFGINAAVGVMIAYVTVIFFTTSLLLFFDREQIVKETKSDGRLSNWLGRCYSQVRVNPKKILMICALVMGLCFIGISMITTNYDISSTLPRNSNISNDFKYFEKEFAGFRPLEFTVQSMGDYQVDSYEVVSEISKLEDHLKSTGVINAILSQATMYKSINKMNNSNRAEAYVLTDNRKEFASQRKMVRKSRMLDQAVLINKERTKTRISSRIADIGADSIRILNQSIDQWITTNLDQAVVSVRSTGTGLIIDKNAVYIRNNLLQGLALALIIVSILMGFLFKSFRMVIVALIPNIIPLLFAAGLIGWLGIDLEAGISIIFAIVFGIAVDDTIHFLSKYKLERVKGRSVEESLEVCYTETGKAIMITTVILFFGFMVLLLSNSQPTNIVGLLISVTLVSALVFDLYLLPILIRYLMPKDT